MSKTYYNQIGGEYVASSSGDTTEVRNPANTDDVLGIVPASTIADVQSAVGAAHDAFGKWAGMTGPERGRILYKAANLLEGRIEEWAEALTREEGKTRTEARNEVIRSVELFRYYAGEGWRVGGDVLPPDTPNTLLYSVRVPVGVVGLITPWNFPLSIPVWKMAPALVVGNTVVFKPASATPIMAFMLGDLLKEAGLPAGVLNIISGGGGVIGDALVTDKRIAAVSFTGSYKIGHSLYQKTAQSLVRTHLELGGKNPLIVAADADLDKAVLTAVRGGFALTGQACTATSRVIVEKPVLEEYTKRLVAAAQAIKVGPGLADGVQMGPAVSAGQRKTDLEYVQIAQDEGARLMTGGVSPEGADYAKGHFVTPTVFANVRNDMRIAQEEVFGPVIGVIGAEDLEEAFAIANDTNYGLSTGIVTNDVRNALRFAERAEAGMVKVNQPTAGLSIQAPFGGFKDSGSGMFREMGKGATDFYTKIKTVYIDGQ